MDGGVTLGEKLKQARADKGITQEEAARFIGVKAQTISGYENNYRQPDAAILRSFADLYNTSTDFLLGRVDNNLPFCQANQTESEKTMSKETLDVAKIYDALPEDKKMLFKSILSMAGMTNDGNDKKEATSGE